MSLLFVSLVVGARAQTGFDSGGYPTELTVRFQLEDEEAGAPIQAGRWLRLRGFVRAPLPEEKRLPGLNSRAGEEVETVRQALAQLRNAGYRSVAFLRWGRVWPSGVRTDGGAGNRAPLDLREAYARARALAETYGDLIDGWEIENEPDIGFFADTGDVFAAYYKAVALGILDGRARIGPRFEGEGTKVEWPRATGGAPDARPGVGPTAGRGTGESQIGDLAYRPARVDRSGEPARSLVVMPPMALPPGPFVRQLLDNGFLSYTEGANLHFYGFAEDYGAVHDRWREALERVERGVEGEAKRARTAERVSRQGEYAPAGMERRLPVFVTEWGYPRLDGVDAQTVEGRVRQWGYFRSVQRENFRRRVAAPMAFYLPAYFEYGAKEFGLGMPREERRAAHYGFAVAGDGIDSPNTAFAAGGVAFAPADFGAREAEPWMRWIGRRIGDSEASPALAWLIGQHEEHGSAWDDERVRAWRRLGHFRSPHAGHPPPSWRGDWKVRTEAPSPVVFDFIAGEGVYAAKTYNGYFVESAASGGAKGTFVFYNFSAEPAEVSVAWPEGVTAESGMGADGEAAGAGRFVLGPGERREVRVRLRAPEGRFAAEEVRLAAAVRSAGTTTVSRWASRFYPNPVNLQVEPARSFDYPAESARKNRRWVERRPHAAEELRLQPAGERWLATPGVTVEETATGWRFHVSAFPGKYFTPAIAELPLPDDWAPLDKGLMLSYRYWIAPATFALRTPLRPDDPDPTRRLQTGRLGDMIESYVRTHTGALYSTQPRLKPGPLPQTYQQLVENFTPHFPGRLAAPLRLERERPVSLVFYLRPEGLPTVFEIDRPMWARSSRFAPNDR